MRSEYSSLRQLNTIDILSDVHLNIQSIALAVV